MDRQKILQSLGLVKKAGKLITGETPVLDKIKRKQVYLVFLANDTLSNTTKRIKDKTDYYHVKLIHDFSTEELNQAIGTKNRKVIGITDRNFAKMINSQLDI